jgi:hypothetical protein
VARCILVAIPGLRRGRNYSSDPKFYQRKARAKMRKRTTTRGRGMADLLWQALAARWMTGLVHPTLE